MPLFRRRLAAAIDLGLPPPPPRRPPTLIETVEPATEDSASELERLGSLATSSRRETWRSRDRCLPRRPLERLVGVKSLESAVEKYGLHCRYPAIHVRNPKLDSPILPSPAESEA